MAETENITILKVNTETGEAVRNIADLKNNIKVLKDNLDKLDIGTEEYQKTLESLKVNQTALKNAMYATTASLGDVTKAATGTGQSYNALVARMAAMKEELRATDVATEEGKQRFKELAESINEVNDQLKDMDAMQGNYQRNVGNYKSALDGLGGALGPLQSGMNEVKNQLGSASPAFKATSSAVNGLKTGIAAINTAKGLKATISLLRGMKLAAQENTAATEANTAALSTMATATTAATSALNSFKTALITTGIGALVVGVGLLISKLQEFISGAEDSADALAREEERTRKLKEANEELLNSYEALMKARNKSDIYIYSQEIEGMVAVIEQIRDINAEIRDDMDTAMAYAIEAMGDQAELYQDFSAEEAEIAQNNAFIKQQMEEISEVMSKGTLLIEKYISSANLIEATIGKSDYDKKLAAINHEAQEFLNYLELLKNAGVITAQQYEKQVAAIKRAQEIYIADLEATRAAAADREYKQAKANAQRVADAAADANKTERQRLEDKYKEDLALLQKYNIDTTELTKKYNADLAALDKKEKEKDNKGGDEEGKRLLANLKLVKEGLELRLKTVEHFSEEEKKVKGDLAKATYDIEVQNIKNTIANEDERNAALLLAKDKYVREMLLLDQWADDRAAEQRKLRLNNELLELDGDSIAKLKKTIELKQLELDTLHQLEGESEDEFRARQLQKEKEYRDAKAALTKQYVSNVTSIANATASILSSVASAYEDEIKSQVAAGKMSEEEGEKQFKRVKAMQISVATINMLTGITTALSGLFTTKSGPWDIALAAVQAATIAASGIANIMKIKNTQLGGTATPDTKTAVNAPSVPYSVQQVRNVTNASDEERLNNMLQNQQVYILSSDIEASQNARKVQVTETSF